MGPPLLNPQQADLLGVTRYRQAKVYAALAAAAEIAVAVATNVNVCVSMFRSVERLVDQGIYKVHTSCAAHPFRCLCACLHDEVLTVPAGAECLSLRTLFMGSR